MCSITPALRYDLGCACPRPVNVPSSSAPGHAAVRCWPAVRSRDRSPVGDFVGEVRHYAASGPSGEDVRERGDQQAHSLRTSAEHQESMARAEEGCYVGSGCCRTLRRVEAALHEDRITGRVAAQAVEARLAVEVALRGVDLAGELIVEETAAVIEPLRIGRLPCRGSRRAGPPVGDPSGHAGPILAAILGEPVATRVPSGEAMPPVERQV